MGAVVSIVAISAFALFLFSPVLIGGEYAKTMENIGRNYDPLVVSSVTYNDGSRHVVRRTGDGSIRYSSENTY